MIDKFNKLIIIFAGSGVLFQRRLKLQELGNLLTLRTITGSDSAFIFTHAVHTRVGHVTNLHRLRTVDTKSIQLISTMCSMGKCKIHIKHHGIDIYDVFDL